MERKEAIAAGVTKYFTGRPCRSDHTSDRYTASGVCCACLEATRKSGARSVPDMRRKIIAGTQEIKLFVPKDRWEETRENIAAIGQYRFPGAAAEAFSLKRWLIGEPGAGMLHVRVLVPNEDVAAVLELGRLMVASRAGPVTVPAARVDAPKPPAWVWNP